MTVIEKRAADLTSYINRTRRGPCFICQILAGNPDYFHHIIYKDDKFIAFLDKYPTIAGHILVAPRQHLEHVISDYSINEYIEFQRLVYRIANAVCRALPTERMYIYSLGSQQGNSHLHWHIAPLPPGVPYEKQQFAALMMEHGVLNLTDEEMASIADKIRKEIECTIIS